MARGKTPSPPDPGLELDPATLACAADLIEVLPEVVHAVRTAMRRQVDGGLSVPLFRCLNHVALKPGTSVGGLAAFMGITMPTASANADRLARAGLLRAQPASDDRRRVELKVTAAGQALLKRMRARAAREMALGLGQASASDVQLVRQALAVLRRSFVTGTPAAAATQAPANAAKTLGVKTA